MRPPYKEGWTGGRGLGSLNSSPKGPGRGESSPGFFFTAVFTAVAGGWWQTEEDFASDGGKYFCRGWN